MRLKLRDLEHIGDLEVNYKAIVKNALSGRRFLKKNFFNRGKIRLLYRAIVDARQINVSECVPNPDSKIKCPGSIDSLTFKAMLELQSSLEGKTDANTVLELVVETIAIGCYSENTDGPYESRGRLWDKFREDILNSPLEDML